MIEFPNGGILLESVAELPTLPERIGSLYLDYETSSGHQSLDSLSPWKHCRIAGAGFTWDDHPRSYYLPVNAPSGNLPGDVAAAFLRDAVNRSRSWRNNNVKYDVHVHQNNVGPVPPSVELHCLTVKSKLIDSDRGFGRGTYQLDSLSRDWLHEEIGHLEEAMHPYLAGSRNKDYGQVAVDVIGHYGSQDPLSARRLDAYTEAEMPEESRRVWETEVKLTRVLVDMESRGVLVDPQELKITHFKTLHALLQIEQRLTELVGRSFRPHVNDDCYDVLCNQYGLPVLAWTNIDKDGNETDKSNPSFDKHALKKYLVHPLAPKHVVALMMEYRQLNTFLSLFVVPWQELHVDGVLHPNHNQCIRTGRLSCSDPNTQQCSKLAKALVHCRRGHVFMSNDQNQIEFRTIAHYIQNSRVIKAYNEDPDTDFHEWVAGICGMKRRPAKTMNFMMGYGGGRKKTVTVMSNDQDVVADIMLTLEKENLPDDAKAREFDRLSKMRGMQVYERYHDELPELKRTTMKVADVCRARGYVRDVRGRRRRLPADHSYRAFNTINQASAADIFKERVVALHDATRGTGIELMLNVHDEVLTEMPVGLAQDQSVLEDVLDVLEFPDVWLRVPLRCSAGVSRSGEDGGTWAQAGDESRCVTLRGVGADYGVLKPTRVPHVPGRALFAAYGGRSVVDAPPFEPA